MTLAQFHDLLQIVMGWENYHLHEFTAQNRTYGNPDPETAYPRCSAGEKRCPPEDVGSLSGYERYLAILADPEDEEHQDMLDWCGPFDPELFSVDDVNAKSRKRFRSRSKKSGGSSLPPELVGLRGNFFSRVC